MQRAGDHGAGADRPADGAGDDVPESAVVTVAVCTRDRASLLDRCLASLTGVVGLGAAEVLVVDNGSTDATPAVAERWAATLPLRRVVEPCTGLSHARNRALDVARSDVVAFLDDDVLVAPGWLAALRQAFARPDDGTALPGVVAGRVDLRWPGGRPGWLPDSREVWFARLDLGEQPRVLADREFPVGANMAVRRSAAAEVGGFDPDLGYAGRRLLGNEEVDFVDRLRRAGYGASYEPAMRVDHVVEGDRVSRRYLLRRVYSQGRSDVRMEQRDGSDVDAATAAREALGRATVRGWRSDVGRLRRPGGLERNVVDVLAGRAKQLGRAREWWTVRGDAAGDADDADAASARSQSPRS